MLQEKAKSNLRRLRAVSLLPSVPILLYAVGMGVLLILHKLPPIPGLLLYFVLALLWSFLTRPVVVRAQQKYVYNVFYEELNVPLFLEIVRRAGKNDPYGSWQLQALYAEGRYADVVSLCARQLQNPFAKRMRLAYFSYLENVYFQMGDDEKLRAAYEATEAFLMSFKSPEKVRRKMPVQAFYAAYLNRDPDGCEAYFSAVPVPSRIASVSRLLMQARAAQLRDDPDEARRLLIQVLKEAPNTPVAMAAQAHLNAIERGEGYETAFPEALPDPLFPVLSTEKSFKTRRAVYWAILGALLLIVLAGELNDRRTEAEYEAFCEEVRLVMEADYDGVSVLYCFTISDGESWLDSLALCSAEQGVILSALYYLDDPNETLYDPLVTLTEKDFANGTLPYRVFEGSTADYHAACTFYTRRQDVPQDAVYSCAVTVYGRELWFAVVYVGENPPSNLV